MTMLLIRVPTIARYSKSYLKYPADYKLWSVKKINDFLKLRTSIRIRGKLCVASHFGEFGDSFCELLSHLIGYKNQSMWRPDDSVHWHKPVFTFD
jgi:hypothetical protein